MKKELKINNANADKAYGVLIGQTGEKKTPADKLAGLTTGEKISFLVEYGEIIAELAESLEEAQKELGGKSIPEIKAELGFNEKDELTIVSSNGRTYVLSTSESRHFDFDEVKENFVKHPESIPDIAKKTALQNAATIKKLWKAGIIPAGWCHDESHLVTKLVKIDDEGGSK